MCNMMIRSECWIFLCWNGEFKCSHKSTEKMGQRDVMSGINDVTRTVVRPKQRFQFFVKNLQHSLPRHFSNFQFEPDEACKENTFLKSYLLFNSSKLGWHKRVKDCVVDKTVPNCWRIWIWLAQYLCNLWWVTWSFHSSVGMSANQLQLLQQWKCASGSRYWLVALSVARLRHGVTRSWWHCKAFTHGLSSYSITHILCKLLCSL